jgi:hypothetical protein
MHSNSRQGIEGIKSARTRHAVAAYRNIMYHEQRGLGVGGGGGGGGGPGGGAAHTAPQSGGSLRSNGVVVQMLSSQHTQLCGARTACGNRHPIHVSALLFHEVRVLVWWWSIESHDGTLPEGIPIPVGSGHLFSRHSKHVSHTLNLTHPPATPLPQTKRSMVVHITHPLSISVPRNQPPLIHTWGYSWALMCRYQSDLTHTLTHSLTHSLTQAQSCRVILRPSRGWHRRCLGRLLHELHSSAALRKPQRSTLAWRTWCSEILRNNVKI